MGKYYGKYYSGEDCKDCGNNCAILFLSIAGKTMARMLLHHLSLSIAAEVLPETQCGFLQSRSTIDMVFSQV